MKAVSSAAPATPPALPAAYRFGVAAELTSLVGERSLDLRRREVPGGARLYLGYSDGAVGFDADEVARQAHEAASTGGKAALEAAFPGGGDWDPPTLLARLRDAGTITQQKYVAEHGLWTGLAGKVVSSGDWALLRSDGVLALDARLSIKADDGSLIALALAGLADLTAAYPGETGPQAYRSWLDGNRPTRPAVPLRLSLRFDVPGSPEAVPPPIARRYVHASKFHWRYGRLARGVFVGAGTLSFRPAGQESEPDTGFASAVSFDVHEVG